MNGDGARWEIDFLESPIGVDRQALQEKAVTIDRPTRTGGAPRPSWRRPCPPAILLEEMGTPRLSALEATALAAFARRARELLDDRLVRIVLFGSRARGEGRDDSDLDLLVEVDGSTRQDRGRVIDLACDVGLEHHLVLSPLVAAAGSLRETPLGARIEADGVAL